MAGLDPATHVSFDAERAANEDVDARVKPGQGGSAPGLDDNARRAILGGNAARLLNLEE